MHKSIFAARLIKSMLTVRVSQYAAYLHIFGQAAVNADLCLRAFRTKPAILCGSIITAITDVRHPKRCFFRHQRVIFCAMCRVNEAPVSNKIDCVLAIASDKAELVLVLTASACATAWACGCAAAWARG
ncbi:hypothetical protein BN1095_4580001 [Clostridioides difficile]|uniref:Uncharacterized protein n=1 Tax=Clostridioides difficile TaxID=1496 RepID=A0A069AXA2_CLODI|nr:hypothetical protein BN1095_4580001 [Clostridioides difficile]